MSLRDQDSGRLGELLGRYVEQRLVHGVHMDPQELCRDDPALLGPLRECIGEYEQLDRLLAAPRGLVGRDLLHYRIVAQLGAGGMGQVYAAEDTKLGRRVAVKVLPPEMAAHRERLERFRREARIVAALNHPNIVTLFSVEEAAGVHFLTMELVEGKTLDALIATGGPELGTIPDIAGQLVDALVAAHERGIVHRDLKPANVMVDAEGRLKVLDFGLAKLRAPPESDDRTDSARTLTMEGRVLGTVPYMSPEQVLCQAVDPRTDLFALGVILYQMVTGRRPFRGESQAELVTSILRDAPVPPTELRPGFSPALERIVLRCLEKEPGRRFQTALEVRDELRQLERQADGSQALAEVLPVAFPPARRAVRRRALTIAAAFVAVLAIAWGGWLVLWSGWPATGAATSAPAAALEQQIARHRRTSLAVLHFRNLTGDPQLDWLSSGITEMLVTDLSQSPEIEVLSTSRLYQVLKDLDALEQTALPLELIREVGSRAGVKTVVRGTYARLGDVFRIALTIEGAADGTTLTSKRVEGRGEESLFAMVDELSAAIRNNFEVERPAESPATVRAVTTTSLEAWRLYSEASAFSRQSKRTEAITLLEKAVEMDPNFALALIFLGNLHEYVGHTAEAREYKRRAFELSEHLPLDLRYRIEGTFYSTWATYGRGIEALRQALALHPEWTDLRSHLAYSYAYLERYEEASEELERIRVDGSTYPGNYTLAADVYAALDRFETGYRLLADFSLRHPDNWQLQLKLGWLLIEWGNLAEAVRHLERARELRPFDYNVPYGLWRLQVRLEDWQQADVEAAEMAGSGDSLGRWRGAISQARNLTYRGRTGPALARFDEAVQALPGPDAYTALARCWKAELLLQRGEAARALVEARRAQEEGRGEFPELKGLALAALAEERLGRPAVAQALAETLRQKWESHPNRVEERQLHQLAGLLALDRGQTEDAVRELERAESLLPPRGIEIHWHVYPEHVPIWYALGKAELAAGRDQKAQRWFQRATSASEHVEQPVPYVRSFYYLGRIHQRHGETAEARRNFDRFRRYWQEGDLDREQVEEALAAVR